MEVAIFRWETSVENGIAMAVRRVGGARSRDLGRKGASIREECWPGCNSRQDRPGALHWGRWTRRNTPVTTVFSLLREQCPCRSSPSSLTAPLLCTHLDAQEGGVELLPPSQYAFTKRVGEDPSPSPQSDSEHSPRLVLIPHTMITSLCFCSTLSTHPHTTLIPRANKPRVRQLWRGARRRQGGRCRVAL